MGRTNNGRENQASSFCSTGQNPEGEEEEGISITTPPFCRTLWHPSATWPPVTKKLLLTWSQSPAHRGETAKADPAHGLLLSSLMWAPTILQNVSQERPSRTTESQGLKERGPELRLLSPQSWQCRARVQAGARLLPKLHLPAWLVSQADFWPPWPQDALWRQFKGFWEQWDLLTKKGQRHRQWAG